MSIKEMNERIDAMSNVWDQYKKVNDARVRDIERKGNSDPLLSEQLNKMNIELDEQKRRMDVYETSGNRPMKEMELGHKAAENTEYKKVFEGYLRKGAVSGLEAFEKKALSVGSDPDGGYLVSKTLSEQIVKYIADSSVMREIASVEEISADSYDIIIDYDVAAAGWTTETGAVADTNTPLVTKKTINTFELYAQPKATQKLVDDAAIDIEAWLAQKVADIFVGKENTAFISGNGTTQPKGILAYAAGTAFGQVEQVNSGTSAVITADGLLKVYYALKNDYAKNATFLMNRSSVQAVRLLKDTTNQYLWQPGLAAGTPDTLFGVPVRQVSDMPVPAANALAVVVGDFKRGYKIIDHLGIRVLRDPFTEKPFVKFYTTKRVGGEVVNFEAIKILKLAV